MKIKKRAWIIGISLSLVFIISFFFDKYVYFFQGMNFLKDFFNAITNLGHFLTVLIIGGMVLYKTKWFKPFFYSLFGSAIIGSILKFIIQRPRPFTTEYSPFGFIDYSFPSFHAMFAVIGLIFLNKKYPKYRYIWIFMGLLVLFSRVYLGLHYFSDVIFGVIIAYCICEVKWN